MQLVVHELSIFMAYVSNTEYKIMSSDTVMPVPYGLPKIHYSYVNFLHYAPQLRVSPQRPFMSAYIYTPEEVSIRCER